MEGSGKTTQARLLARFLEERGVPVVVAREPGSTPLGERVRETVLADVGVQVPARSELFLMLAARAAFVEQVVRPGVAAGKVVVADRFELSTLAYQGAGRGIPLEEVRACNRVATGGLTPAATLLLDLDPEEGERRQRAAGKAPDRLEREERAFHRRVAMAYREHADEVPGVVRIDAAADPPEVHRRVLATLARRFPETFDPMGFTNEELTSPAPPAGAPSSQCRSEAE